MVVLFIHKSKQIHSFSSFWLSLSVSFILWEAPELGDAPALWSKLDPKERGLPPLRSRLDSVLLILLRVLVIPLVWRRESTGLSSGASNIGMLSRACTSQDAQSGILLSCMYLSFVTERSASTSRAPNIAPTKPHYNKLGSEDRNIQQGEEASFSIIMNSTPWAVIFL